MSFGVRLGPFRLSTSRGKLYGGVNVGPFSASGKLAGGGRPQPSASARTSHATLEETIGEAVAQGYRVVARAPHAVSVRRGWRQWHIREIRGGVQVEPTLSTPLQLALAFLLAGALVAVCLGLAA